MAGFFSNLYKLYTSDLKDGDVSRLFRSEAPEVYQFYLDSAKRNDYKKMTKGQRKFALLKDLIYTFLSKLSPVRRIAFSIAFAIFLYASMMNMWFWGVLSFLTVVLLLAFEVAEKVSATNELDIAKNIQEELIMTESPVYEGLQVAAYSKPAKVVGGDFLNFFPLNSSQKKHFYLLGDISGKGMLAALYMVRVHSVLTYLTKNQLSAKDVLKELNKVLNSIFKPGLFFTAAVLEVEEGEKIKAIRAGHTPLLHFCAESKEVKQLKPTGIGIGMRDKGIFDKTLEEIEIDLKVNDILFIYSDGVNEAVDEFNREFGIARIEKNLIKNAEKSPDEIIKSILRSINNFTYNVPMRDDITILVLKRTPRYRTRRLERET
ncbi:MAG: serine/threonine-protein phosphatase [Ignavibacteriales bacterium]|nr:serine/threonine-protein phosphatase [Ignavibacteriales bacterium]